MNSIFLVFKIEVSVFYLSLWLYSYYAIDIHETCLTYEHKTIKNVYADHFLLFDLVCFTVQSHYLQPDMHICPNHQGTAELALTG